MVEDIRYIYEKKIVLEAAKRGGSTIYGGGLRKITKYERVLQVKINGEWQAVRSEDKKWDF